MDRKKLESLNGEQLIQEAARLISEEEIEEAVKIFTYLTERLPDAYLPLLSKCTCLIQLERYEEALKDGEKLLKLKNIPINEELAPGNSTLHSVAYIRMAKCYKELGKIEEAEKLIKKRVELEKKVLKPKEIENKSDELDEQKEGDSNNSNYSHRKDFSSSPSSSSSPKSSSGTNSTTNIDDQVEKLRLEGNEYYKLGKYRESCEKYLQALKINSNHLLSHSNLALVLTKLGNYDEALKHSDKCIQLDSKWAKGYYRKGNILFEQKKFEEAIKNYQLAESYGGDKTDINKKIELIKKFSTKNKFQNKILKVFDVKNIKIIVLIILIGIILWKFNDGIIYLFGIYFNDLW